MRTTTRQHEPTRRATRRRAACFAFTGSGLLALFWTFYFTGLLAAGRTDALLAAYEAAFPVADAILAVVLLAAGIGLRRGRRHGPFCLTAGAAMALYLGILDLTFYLRQGAYATLTGDVLVGLVTNLLCLVGGVAGLVLGWTLGRKNHVRHAA